jgi:ABC-type transport system involved in cytochrome c biogenesis permease subunit
MGVWEIYNVLFFVIIITWFSGVLLRALGSRNVLHKTGEALILSGVVLCSGYVTLLWIQLGRPPFKTLAETRLWYSVFLSLTGVILFYRWKEMWLLAYSLLLAGLFLALNYMHPETISKNLMPALQSPWFVPHVVVYMIGYALLAMSSLIAIHGLISGKPSDNLQKLLLKADNVVYIGFGFLTFGLLFGALWAKEAWGHYWTWDPKEIWALLTWMIYLVYMHLRIKRIKHTRTATWILAFSFIVLLLCWFGINYLPVAENSVHTYSS